MSITLTDKISYKRLITACNNELWYGDIDVAENNMTELAAANGDIDTSDQLTVAAAFQKVFIANGSNLKVADFINTKLTITALDTAPTVGSIVTQATSEATMVVDYVNAAKTNIYGYTTSGTFVTTAGYTLSGGSMSPETRVPSAVTSSPHWYDWTIYDGDTTTYGTMPNKAYLVTVYRGRLVLAGNPEYPNQWYMARVANPFDFLYGSDDAMSAVAGNNADAGQCPDIIRALISFHDDYLIFGCANSVWVLRGDPVSGGSLDSLDSTTGIFGANSWCFDGERNLYFWGNGGIYKIASEVFSSNIGPENITEIVLPKIITDEAADPTTHRITMGYDKKRQGIIVSITKISDGTNSDYFYSLQTKGFYPETYPEECGPYSLFYYAANDTNYADLLLGCRDGYIRRFVDTAKSDDIGNTDEAIDAYLTYPITALAEEKDFEGKLSSIVFESAGGAASGALEDSDGFNYEIHFGDDAETVLEDIMDGATAKITGAVTGTGRTNKLRHKGRGAYMGVKIYNSTADETFGINRILYETKHAGRIR